MNHTAPIRIRDSFAHRIFATLQIVALVTVEVSATAITPTRVAHAAGGQVTGIVFEDYNANGLLDTNGTLSNNGTGAVGIAVDRGIGGVTVTAYDASNAPVGNATSAAPSGAYTLTLVAAGPYRLEFGALPKGYQPSFHGPSSSPGSNGTSVQFVPDVNTANVNFGILSPDNYCQNNPTVVANCFNFGGANQANANKAALYSFPYSAGSNGTSTSTIPSYDVPTPTTRLTMNQIGTTFGLVWARNAQRLYASAFFKKHTGFGPGADTVLNDADDPGAIYVIDPATNAVVRTFTVPDATTNGHDVTSYLFDGFNTGWDAAGKTSLGGIALSPDEATLYVMNMQNRALYALNATTGAVIVSATVPLSPPQPPEGVCDSDNVRPFAVSVFGGTGYIGMVCSGPTTADLRGYVYSFTLSTLTFGTSPALQFPLNYSRGFAKDDPAVANSVQPAAWNAWAPTFTTKPVTVTDPGGQFPVYPQPQISSIAFDVDGNMVLGLRDRFGDQTGNEVYSNPLLPTVHYYGVPAGDTLRACGSPAAGWLLEQNARCGGTGTGPQNSNQGPGGGEFYWRDEYPPYHQEVSLGGSAYVPGYPDVLISTYNPVPITDTDTAFDGGVRWMDNVTGGMTKAYRLYNGDLANGNLFGKAAGLGDLEVLCDVAPLELGNRVWQDANANGRQDANEIGISNVVVGLYNITGTLLVTTTTAADGTYYFTATTQAGEQRIQPNTAYKIGLDAYQPNLLSYGPTTPNYGGITSNDAISDVNDSDGIAAGSFVSVGFVTGGAGASNHSFDFGFKAISRLGDYVWLDKNKNGLQDTNEPGVQNVTVNLYRTGEAAPISTTTTLTNGLYIFDELIPGSYTVEFIKPSADYVWTTRNAGDVTKDSDADLVSGRTSNITLPINTADLTWDAGLVCTANGIVRGTLSAGVLTSIPIVLIPQNVPGAISQIFFTRADGSYEFKDVIPGQYVLQVHDAFLNQSGYVPTPSTVNPITIDIPGCVPLTVNFTYVLTEIGAFGDFVWYDINADGKQDEWFDANGDGKVTKNSLDPNNTVPLDKFEWYDINGDGRYDGPENEGELRKCGLEVSSPDLLTLFKGNDLNTVTGGRPTNIFGYYGFHDLALRDWQAKFKATDAELDAKAKAMFATAKCKPLPGAPPAIDYPSLVQRIAQGAPTTGPASMLAGPSDANARPVTCMVSTPVTNGKALTSQAPVYLDADFGVLCADDLAALGDYVWLDANKNGLQDKGEAGIPGVTVTLYSQTGVVLSTTTTISGGLYLFPNLFPGTYAVQFTLPPQAAFTQRNAGSDRAIDSDADVSTGRTISIPLAAGQTDLTWDAGIVCAANGAVRGKLSAGGLSRIPVFLLPQNAPGAIAEMSPTQADGSYEFKDVKPGTYLVQVHDAYLNQQGYLIGPGITNPMPIAVVGCDTQLANFTYARSSSGAIGVLGDFVWYDINSNGKQDEWFDANADGKITKNSLDANNIVPLDQYEWWDINGDGRSDGPENEGELRKCGLEVTTADLLTLYRGDALSTVAGSHRTGLLGYYLFDNLQLREWAVKFKSTDAELTAKAKAMFLTAKCKPLPGAPPAVDYPSASQTSASIQPTSASAGPIACGISTKINDLHALTAAAPVYLDADFGIVCADDVAAIGDFVWLDTNRNGIQDNGESGVPNATVTLHNAAGEVVSTTLTDANGKYLFGNLVPGIYFIEFGTPPALTCTTANAGSDDRLDSDMNCASGMTQLVTLAPGETNLTVDAGFHPAGPTAITLSSFTVALQDGGGAKISWRTALERNTFGFIVLRSKTGKLADAVAINKEIVVAKGPSGYSVIDAQGTANDAYWLQETELDGATNVYGPVSSTNANESTNKQVSAVIAPLSGAGGVAVSTDGSGLTDGNGLASTDTNGSTDGRAVIDAKPAVIAPSAPAPAPLPLRPSGPNGLERQGEGVPMPQAATAAQQQQPSDVVKPSSASSSSSAFVSAASQADEQASSVVGVADAVEVARSGQSIQTWVNHEAKVASTAQVTLQSKQAKPVTQPTPTWLVSALAAVLMALGMAGGVALRKRRHLR